MTERTEARPTTDTAGSPAGGTMSPTTFERERLDLLRGYGFACQSVRLGDRADRQTYAMVGGEGSPTTVLLHGGLSEGSEWATLAGRLADRVPGRLVIPDRPGCGLSYPLDYRGVDFRRAAVDWTREVVDALGAERVDLVGNSMGGYFAAVFAAAHPDRVGRVAFLGAPAGLSRRLPLFIRLWGNAVTGQIIRRLPIKDAEALRQQVFAKLLVRHPERVPTRQLELSLAAADLPGTADAAFSMLRSVTTLRGARRDLLVLDDVADLEVPALFVWGDDDAFASPASGRPTADRMADARFETLEEAGHLPWLDRPDDVARLVSDFLVSSAPTV